MSKPLITNDLTVKFHSNCVGATVSRACSVRPLREVPTASSSVWIAPGP